MILLSLAAVQDRVYNSWIRMRASPSNKDRAMRNQHCPTAFRAARFDGSARVVPAASRHAFSARSWPSVVGWGGWCVECSPARHSVFLTAESVETGMLPSLGPKIRIGLRGVCQTGRWGSPRAFRAGFAVLAATRIPKTVLEELAFGGSCHRALGRARSEGWKTARTPTTSPSERVKGEPGSRNAPARASSTAGPRLFGPMLGGAEEQHDGCRAIR
jgi:hypothetical protein